MFSLCLSQEVRTVIHLEIPMFLIRLIQGPPYSPRKSSRQGRENMNGVDQTRQTYTPNYGGNQDSYRVGKFHNLQ